MRRKGGAPRVWVQRTETLGALTRSLSKCNGGPLEAKAWVGLAGHASPEAMVSYLNDRQLRALDLELACALVRLTFLMVVKLGISALLYA